MKRMIILALALAAFSAGADTDCFIDGTFAPRCYEYVQGINGSRLAIMGQTYFGVSWPVYTAETPSEVWAESMRRAGLQVPYETAHPKLSVKHVRIDTPEHYPDVICIDFHLHGGPKTSQVCFDTMEITER